MLNQRNRLGNELTQQYRQLRGRVSDVAAHALGSPRPLAGERGEGEAELLALTPIVSRTL